MEESAYIIRGVVLVLVGFIIIVKVYTRKDK